MAYQFTAEDAFRANRRGEPIMWGEREVEAALADHRIEDRADLDAVAPVNADGERDAWLVLQWLGY